MTGWVIPAVFVVCGALLAVACIAFSRLRSVLPEESEPAPGFEPRPGVLGTALWVTRMTAVAIGLVAAILALTRNYFAGGRPWAELLTCTACSLVGATCGIIEQALAKMDARRRREQEERGTSVTPSPGAAAPPRSPR